MYQKISLLVTVAILITSCSNPNKWNRLGLKGKVESYLERYYEAETKFGKWEVGELHFDDHVRVRFNQLGEIKEMDYLTMNNELLSRQIPKYKNGMIIEFNHYDSDGKLETKEIRNPISKNEIEFEVYNENGLKTGEGRLFYKKGRIIKQVYTYLNNSEISSKWITNSDYDKKGKLILTRIYDEKDDMVYSMKFEYLEFDHKGNWTKRLDYYSDDYNPESIVIREIEYY